jgi:hypothetical protein
MRATVEPIAPSSTRGETILAESRIILEVEQFMVEVAEFRRLTNVTLDLRLGTRYGNVPFLRSQTTGQISQLRREQFPV